MGLRRCGLCGSMVSERAGHCPRCGGDPTETLATRAEAASRRKRAFADARTRWDKIVAAYSRPFTLHCEDCNRPSRPFARAASYPWDLVILHMACQQCGGPIDPPCETCGCRGEFDVHLCFSCRDDAWHVFCRRCAAQSQCAQCRRPLLPQDLELHGNGVRHRDHDLCDGFAALGLEPSASLPSWWDKK